MGTHSKWANEQTLKTELRIPYYLSVHAFFYCYKRLFVLLYLQVSVAMHAYKNDTQVYYSGTSPLAVNSLTTVYR